MVGGAFRVKERLLNSYIIETIYGNELAGEYNARRLRPLKALKGSSLEAYEAARRAGATVDEALGLAGQLMVEPKEPSHEEEGTARDTEEKQAVGAKDEEDGWMDEDQDDEEEAPGESIAQRLRARKARL
jgi:hypothetical protein